MRFRSVLGSAFEDFEVRGSFGELPRYFSCLIAARRVISVTMLRMQLRLSRTLITSLAQVLHRPTTKVMSIIKYCLLMPRWNIKMYGKIANETGLAVIIFFYLPVKATYINSSDRGKRQYRRIPSSRRGFGWGRRRAAYVSWRRAGKSNAHLYCSSYIAEFPGISFLAVDL